jgi:hypothetical protein
MGANSWGWGCGRNVLLKFYGKPSEVKEKEDDSLGRMIGLTSDNYLIKPYYKILREMNSVRLDNIFWA